MVVHLNFFLVVFKGRIHRLEFLVEGGECIGERNIDAIFSCVNLQGVTDMTG